jgi:hypothetical protein
MAEVGWAKAQDLILPLIKDCPWPMALKALQRSAREFFHDTLAWAKWTDDLFTIAGLNEYVPYPGKNIEVIRVLEAKVGHQDYKGANERDFGAAIADNSGECLASFFDSAVYINPTPVADEIPLRIYMVVRPAYTSTGLPTEQWKYIDAIVTGALAWLHALPDRPYTNADRAKELEEKFRMAKGKARSETAKGGFAKKRVVGQYL